MQMEAQLDALLGSGDFEAIAKVLDDAELEGAGAAAADARFDPEEWPYALHMLGHMINGELENARFGRGLHYARSLIDTLMAHFISVRAVPPQYTHNPP